MLAVGQPDRLQFLKQKAEEIGVSKRILWLDPVPRSELPAYTASADLGIILRKGLTLNAKYPAPNKLFDYLQSGIPVVGSRSPQIIRVLQQSGAGICVDSEDPESIASGVNAILADDMKRREMAQKARLAYENDFNYEKQSRQVRQMNPPITVLTSCFNAAEFLEESIESVIGQTFQDFEYVLVDDGSTDNTLSIIKTWAGKDGRIVILTKRNSGPAESRNVGLGVSRSSGVNGDRGGLDIPA